MSTQFVPNYIRRNIDYKPKDILTAQEYNSILNLLIAQGDHNSEWLEYLQNHGIPDAIADISAEEIAEAISIAVQQEIAALTASVINKTSKFLDNPAVTILNVGQQYTGISAFNTLIASKSLKATYAIGTNLVDSSAAYPTLANLNALKTAGNDIVAYSTDAATVTAGTAEANAAAAKAFITTNNFDSNVFIFPNGNNSSDIANIIGTQFKFAANVLNSAIIDPEDYPATASVTEFCDLPIIAWDNTIDVDDIKEYIDYIVLHNKYMILQVNTDSSAYDETYFSQILTYMLTKSGIYYPDNIAEEMGLIEETIGNKLALSEGVYITTESGVKYLNW